MMWLVSARAQVTEQELKLTTQYLRNGIPPEPVLAKAGIGMTLIVTRSNMGLLEIHCIEYTVATENVKRTVRYHCGIIHQTSSTASAPIHACML